MTASDHLSEEQFGFHVSSAENRRSIEARGLRMSKPVVPGNPEGVYFARNPHETLEYADGNSDVWRFPLHGYEAKTPDGQEYTADIPAHEVERWGFTRGDRTVMRDK